MRPLRACVPTLRTASTAILAPPGQVGLCREGLSPRTPATIRLLGTAMTVSPTAPIRLASLGLTHIRRVLPIPSIRRSLPIHT